MDRNTIIAIVLTVIVITIGMTVQTVFFPPEAMTGTTETVTDVSTETETASKTSASFKAVYQAADSTPFDIETNNMIVTFDPAGASVSAIKLKETSAGEEELVDLLIKDNSGKNAFLLYPSSDLSSPITDTFDYTVTENDDLHIVSFNQDFETAEGKIFSIQKKYALSKADQYLFQIAVSMNTEDGSDLPFSLYTLGYDPQVGPAFESLSGNYDYRRAYYKRADKGSKTQVNFKNGTQVVTDELSWAATAGKYFTVIGIPASDAQFTTTFVEKHNETGVPQTDSFYLTRENISGSSITDVYSFYTGPKLTKYLNMYDIAKDNVFGLSEMNLNKVMDTSTWLGWLETILKWILTFFYRIIPNYGVAIILLTILIKLLLQPLSKKGMDSTAKMSALSPKLEELKVKYADNPEAMNAAMAKLYKEEGINPMGSCLPMLIQFPIFIALYGLLNNHYELRGAMFIPGWITDLSVPETIFTLPFNIPFLGNAIHLLPIIYTVSMILSMKITQTASTQNSQAGMMKFMTYGMPIIFFFVMYNAPSGLLVYWTIMNFISIGQQMIVNKKKTAKYAAELQSKEEAKVAKFKAKKRK